MKELDREEYIEIIKKLKKIEEKNNQLKDSNMYLGKSLNKNIIIDDKSFGCDETDYLNRKLVSINESINTELITKMKEKM